MSILYLLSSYIVILLSFVLSAIQFALTGHQFQQLTQTNLVKLLYSSSAGVRVKSAYVEITIDNKDRSIRVINIYRIPLKMFF